jgi:hypothetical protein
MFVTLAVKIKKEKLLDGRMRIKRMMNQAIRGSFECYLNAGKEVTGIDHIAEVNKDIVKLDSSVNMNLWTLNEEMGSDIKIKKKISIEEKRLMNAN